MSGRSPLDEPPHRVNKAQRLKPHARLDAIRQRFHRTTTGRALSKMAIALTGLVVVLVGLALVPLPGPGWFIVLGGVAIWAIEFVWARHLLRTAREWVHRWNLWLKGQRPAVRRPLIAFVLAVVLVAVWLSLKISLGLDPVDRIFRGRFRD